MYTQEILLTILRLVLKDCIFAEILEREDFVNQVKVKEDREVFIK